MSSNSGQRELIRITFSSRTCRPEKRARTADLSTDDPFKIQNPSVRQENNKTKTKSASSPDDDSILFENDTFLQSLPNDIIMAVRSYAGKQCVAYYPLISQQEMSALLPFVLKPMLHEIFHSKSSTSYNLPHIKRKIHDHEKVQQTCVSNAHTGVNMELLEACQRNTVRQLVLIGTNNSDESTMNSEDDIAVLETEHFIQGVWDAFLSTSSSEKCNMLNKYSKKNGWTNEQYKQIIEWFIGQLNLWTGTFVKYVDIDRAVKKVYEKNPGTNPLPIGSTTETILDYLVSIRILLPRNIPKVKCDSYWFTLPLLGKVSQALTAGRKHLITLLKRSYYNELKLNSLLTKSFGDENFKLSANFLVKDFLSRGIVKIHESSSADFVRLIQTKK